jgi:glutathione S-transferase
VLFAPQAALLQWDVPTIEGADMYTLYYSPGTASLAVHLALIELGVPHRLERVDLDGKQQKSAEYLRLNPNGVVPTLVVEGRAMYECAALLLYLAERHTVAGLAPADGTREREPYLQWILHFANTVQPAFRAWFYPNEPAGEANAEAARASARTRVESCFDRLEAHLAEHGPYVAGAHYSVADMLGVMLMRWSRNMPRPATAWPHCRALAERVKSRPAWATLYEREGLTEGA